MALTYDKVRLPVIGAVILALAGFTVLRLSAGTVAPVPPAFVNTAGLAEAMAASRASGRPVLAFATADWCGPCQQFKRGALVHPKVTEWIRQNTHAVYLNVDERQADAEQLSIYSIPALVLIRPDGTRPSRFEGNHSADEVLSFLMAAVPGSAGGAASSAKGEESPAPVPDPKPAG